jgi:GT2 family glycosyltransferase
MYPTYSQLINHSVVTSPTEWIIFINDRCSPTVEEVKKMLKLLENGFACVLLYTVGFMGFSKELIRKIGWWDERFIQGWEDRDWVWRIQQNNFALYESQESTYDYTWRSPLNHPPGKCEEGHLNKKWILSNSNYVFKNLPEEKYQHWDLFIGEERKYISESWMSWENSILGIAYDRVNSGQSGSSFIGNRKIVETFE